MTRDNVERVAKEVHDIFCRLDVLGYLSAPDNIAETIARAAMAATLELAAEDLRDEADKCDFWLAKAAREWAADWLLSRANDVRGGRDASV